MANYLDNETLTSHIGGVLQGTTVHETIRIVSRCQSPDSSTFHTEIIECELDNCTRITLLGKYLGDFVLNSFGHRGGVEYEARVYDHLIKNLEISKPTYYGICHSNDEKVMLLEYLTGAERLTYDLESDPISKAACWIAKFHLFNADKHPYFVNKYDKSYFEVWLNRAKRLSVDLKDDYPWFADLCDYFKLNIFKLVTAPATVIHGEYYPGNILIRNGTVYPIDWESAAIAPGEIDLASLIQGWDEETKKKAIDTYTLTRWGAKENIPDTFFDTFNLSQIYFHLRWLPEKMPQKWVKNPPISWFTELSELATKANYIT